jgi:hypothetical protein
MMNRVVKVRKLPAILLKSKQTTDEIEMNMECLKKPKAARRTHNELVRRIKSREEGPRLVSDNATEALM